MSAVVAGSRGFLGTIGLSLLAIMGVFIVDEFLAKMDRAESQIEADRLFALGRSLMKTGKNDEAIERINDALAIERGKREYLQTLAQAELAEGRASDAETTLNQLLGSDSTDGFANLLMARVFEREGRINEAISYFHRAIYGHWSQDSDGNRKRARFELIDLLVQRNAKAELLAELLPMQGEPSEDLKTRARIGELFLLAGSPSRAEEVYRSIAHDAPNDADAYAGLGQAEFAQGNYRTAERDYQTALRLAPGDQATKHRLELCNEIMLLDPTQRGITPEARYQRSLKLVDLASKDVDDCTKQNPSTEARSLLQRADGVLKAHLASGGRSDAAESNLDLAEQLGQVRKRECKGAPSGTPLELILTKMAQ